MKSHLLTLTAYLVLLSSTTGCVTSSTNSVDHRLTEGNKVVFIPTHYRGHEANFAGEFSTVLERHEFVITDRKALSDYQFELVVYPGHVEVRLSQGSTELLFIETSRPWGYPWPQGSEYKSMIGRALTELDQALAKMSER